MGPSLLNSNILPFEGTVTENAMRQCAKVIQLRAFSQRRYDAVRGFVNRKAVKIVVASLLFLCAAALFPTLRRSYSVRKLQDEVSNEYPRTEAVDRLAEVEGRSATEALLAIAGDPAMYDARQVAIKNLAGRCGYEVGIALSDMLQPQVGLGLRGPISTTLLQCDCRQECLKSVLEYLNRRYWGEKTSGENLSPDLTDPEEAKFEERLYTVLRLHSKELRPLLAHYYGIDKGSTAPSPFGLALIRTMSLRSYCRDLQSSQSEFEQSYSTNSKIYSDVLATEQALGCPKEGKPSGAD